MSAGQGVGPWRAGVVVAVGLLSVGTWTERHEAAEPPPAIRKPFAYDSKGRRDPFLPLVRDGRVVSRAGEAPGSATKPVLHGILWDATGTNSMALLDDVEVRIGEVIRGYTVREIRQDAVVLSNGGEPIVLRVAFEEASPERSAGATRGGEEP